ELILLHLSLSPSPEAATDPEVGPQGSLEQDEWCDDHSAIHRRLDAIQERMEKTVDSLDSEVTSLLNTVSETAWSVPLPPGSPQVDLLEGILTLI
uniref:Placenta-specific protein 9 n=1 Tax=Varanus komodoensis TaxID=61221 RepID=A0A8D2JEJ0_VARKO